MIRFGRGGSLRHSRLQWVLAVAAIGTAVSLPVVLISVGGGVSAHELGNLQHAGYEIVVSTGGSHGINGSHNLTEQILTVSSVTAASPVLDAPLVVFYPGGNVTVPAQGVIPDEFLATLGPTESGLFPSPLPLGDPTDMVHYASGTYHGSASDDILLSLAFENHYGIGVGDHIKLSPTENQSQGLPFLVTGSFGTPGFSIGPSDAYVVLMPLSDLQVLAGYGPSSHPAESDLSDQIQVSVAGSVATDPTALAQVQDKIHNRVPFYSVTTLSQEVQQLQSASAVLTGFYLALSSVGLSVGLIFLALVLLRRVETDRRSIGVRRALGLSDWQIARGILSEGAGLAALGAIAGVLGGYLVVEALATWATSTVQEAAQLAIFDPVTLLAIAAGVVGLSVLAAGVATRTALRTEITEALR
jgi:ABC-type antimicrobial peptide transport system permease subunit